MGRWAERGKALKEMLCLATEPIGFKRLEKAEALDRIEGTVRWKQGSVFCQIPFLARIQELTVGVTNQDKMGDRCKRLHALRPTNEDDMKGEAARFVRTWMPSFEEGMKQQVEYPLMPAGEAIVVGPLKRDNFEPDVVLLYGNPAQIMMTMCGLQKVKYERFQFSFIGEGACVESIGQCYTSGKPSLAIPCYGERSMGQVRDDEIVLALPPGEVDRAIEGLQTLRKIGFKYPIAQIGGFIDPAPLLEAFYPKKK
jgi:uncharacterized protein (DUF169 family)